MKFTVQWQHTEWKYSAFINYIFNIKLYKYITMQEKDKGKFSVH